MFAQLCFCYCASAYISAIAVPLFSLTPVLVVRICSSVANPHLGAEGMRPLQHEVRDTVSISKIVLQIVNHFFINNFSFCLQKGTGFLEEHVYMAGDHTTKGMWL